eukprot:Nk52_evm1s1154 gene=Nk52_evmTU1s1154
MLDKQFTIISGTTCIVVLLIVVLLMLLARIDAAPQVGEIDAMQETVTSPGAPSNSPIYTVLSLGYYTAENNKIYCRYDVYGRNRLDRYCKLKVRISKVCAVQLAKGQVAACKPPEIEKVLFHREAPNRLEMVGLNIDPKVPSSTKGSVDIKIRYGRLWNEGIAKIETSSTPITLEVHMRVGDLEH